MRLRRGSLTSAVWTGFLVSGCSLVLPTEDELVDTASTASGSSASSATSGAGGQPSELEARCAASDALVCEGWDEDDSLQIAVYPGRGLYPPAGSTELRGVRDTSVKASGMGSLRFDIQSGSEADVAGRWYEDFSGVGEGGALYVQFKERLSAELIDSNWFSATGASGFFQVILHREHQTCAPLQLSLSRHPSGNFPFAYTNCGNTPLVTGSLLQQGDFACQSGATGNCYVYPQEAWMTYSMALQIGRWGMPESRIEVRVATSNATSKTIIEVDNATLEPNDMMAGKSFDALTLTPYMNGKDSAQPHATGRVWYDDLIVSRSPIPVP
jgi:hypothetical protein